MTFYDFPHLGLCPKHALVRPLLEARSFSLMAPSSTDEGGKGGAGDECSIMAVAMAPPLYNSGGGDGGVSGVRVGEVDNEFGGGRRRGLVTSMIEYLVMRVINAASRTTSGGDAFFIVQVRSRRVVASNDLMYP